MIDKKSSESRRKLLKSIAAGSGAALVGKSLPENWTKPVVDSVMLPAHAQTSPTCSPVDEPLTVIVSQGDADLITIIVGTETLVSNEPYTPPNFSFTFTVVNGDCSTDYVLSGTISGGTVSGSWSLVETCPQETCTGSGSLSAANPVVVGNATTYTGTVTGELCCTPV